MDSENRLGKKNFYIISLISAIIVLMSSFEAIIRVKDRELFLSFAKDNFPDQLIDTSIFNTYVTSELSLYLIKVFIPISIAILAYLALTKIRFSRIFIFIWTILAAGGFAYTFLEFNFYSVFYYSILLLYIVLILFLYFFVGLNRKSTK